MGRGSKPPEPTPPPAVPQEDDPDRYDEERRAASTAKNRDGVSNHLMSGDADTGREEQKRKLIG